MKFLKFLDLINPYYHLVNLRNFLYDLGFFKSFKIEVPVISVGNLSLGGSGKTTLVRFLAENLHSNFYVVILSRGYKRATKGYQLVYHKGKTLQNIENVGDEPYLLAKLFEKKKLPLSIVVDEDRIRGARKAVKELGAQLIILDDGFQHRRLKRDLDLVLLKKQDLKALTFPLGRLREPFIHLKRADAVILSYQEIDPFEFTLNQIPVFKMFRKNWKILNSNFEKVDPKDKEFIAFCGLGDNLQFLKVLKKINVKVKKFLSFPDHYDYKNFRPNPKESYLTTLKDFYKVCFRENLYFLDFEIEVKGLIEFILKKISHLSSPSLSL